MYLVTRFWHLINKNTFTCCFCDDGGGGGDDGRGGGGDDGCGRGCGGDGGTISHSQNFGIAYKSCS